VRPLVGELTVGEGLRAQAAARAQLAAIEAVAACRRFVDDRVQVAVDRRDRRAAVTEPIELRVSPVAARRAAQHGARQQALAPDGDQRLPVQVPGMERPEPHRRPRASGLGPRASGFWLRIRT
jgi:hypothetical protein